jgi:hypothetical protein
MPMNFQFLIDEVFKMAEIQISVPETIARLYSESEAGVVREVLLGAIRQVALAKLAEEKDNLREALDKIRSFEDKYKLSFSDFERNMPPEGDVQLHEDYVEWSFWADVYERAANDLKHLQLLLE